jgi:ferric-chelate reductase (NADPH)
MLKDAVLNLLFTSARVARAERVAETFRLIDLEMETIWRAGDKLQIETGFFDLRTYTPLMTAPHRLRLLTYLHGNGPGSQWAASVKEGAQIRVRGPQRSIEIYEDDGGAFFGDETSFAMASHTGCKRFVFEVDSIEESRAALDAIELGSATLIEKKADASHLEECAEFLGTNARYLVGNAQSLRTLRKILPETSGVKIKAYWSPGKKGFD